MNDPGGDGPAVPGHGKREQSPRLFGFVQLEFAWALGPPDGRYVLRAPGAGEGDPDHVLVLATLGATRRRLPRRRRRARPVAPEPDPASVAIARATVISAAGLPVADPDAARAWLAGVRRDPGREVESALVVVNRAIAAQRIAAADPRLSEVAHEQALAVRVGYGDGEQVAVGRWAEALDVPPSRAPRVHRTAALRPQERLAALLGARDAPLACEELVLRARLDLDHGRDREAALGLRVALEAALAELEREPGTADLGARLDELRDERRAVGAAANAALAGPLAPDARATVADALGRLEAALRARSAAGVPERGA